MVEQVIASRLTMLARELEEAREMMTEATNQSDMEASREMLTEAGSKVERVMDDLVTLATERRSAPPGREEAGAHRSAPNM